MREVAFPLHWIGASVTLDDQIEGRRRPEADAGAHALVLRIVRVGAQSHVERDAVAARDGRAGQRARFVDRDPGIEIVGIGCRRNELWYDIARNLGYRPSTTAPVP